MITHTIIMPKNLPDIFLTYLQTQFKEKYNEINSVVVQETEFYTSVTLMSQNINEICQAIYHLGQQQCKIEHNL